MSLRNIMCKVNIHRWVVEYLVIDDGLKFPAFRVCENCGKFQQPGLSTITVNWSDSESITQQVLKSKMQIEKNLLSNGKKKIEKN